MHHACLYPGNIICDIDEGYVQPLGPAVCSFPFLPSDERRRQSPGVVLVLGRVIESQLVACKVGITGQSTVLDHLLFNTDSNVEYLLPGKRLGSLWRAENCPLGSQSNFQREKLRSGLWS